MRTPSSLRSKIHAGSEKYSSVSVAFIGAIQSGNASARRRSCSSGGSRLSALACFRAAVAKLGYLLDGFAGDDGLGTLGGDVAVVPRFLIVHLHQQPLVLHLVGADQHERAAQLLAVQDELHLAVVDRL